MAVTRELTIVYGATTIDGSSGIHLHGDPPLRWAMRHDGGQVSFTLVVTASSAANLITASNAVIDQFRTPRQDLTINRGGSAELTLKPSTNTAFDTDPWAEKVGDPFDTGRSQKIAVSIRFGLPANKASLSGRRESTVTVDYDSSRRRNVTIAGVYTALSSNSASAQYLASIDAWATSVLTSLGGTYKQVSPEVFEYFETNKELRFSRQYQELLRDLLGVDAGAVVDVTSDVAEQELSISIRKPAPGDSESIDGPVLRMGEITAVYRASVPGGPEALDSVAEDAAAYIASEIAAAVPEASGLALIETDPDIQYDASRIVLTQLWRAAFQSGWSEYSRTERGDYKTGRTLVPVWSKTRWKRYSYQHPESMTLVVEERGVFVGAIQREARLIGTRPLTMPPPGAEWQHMGTQYAPTQTIFGRDGHTIEGYVIARVSMWEAAAPEANGIGFGAQGA